MSLTVWEVTIAALLAVLAIDLALAVIRRNKETSIKEAAALDTLLEFGIQLRPVVSSLLAGLLSTPYQ